jgi:predicted nuclease of predicted toxin-antitoxin system
VKLLFDQNLSYRLVQTLHTEFPESQHVRDIGLGEATDEAVWQYAAQQDFTIITKDADFHQRSFLFGHPPGYGVAIARPRPLNNSCDVTIPTSSTLRLTRSAPFSSSNDHISAIAHLMRTAEHLYVTA